MARHEIAAFRPHLYQTLHPRPKENAPLSRKIKRIAVVQGELNSLFKAGVIHRH
jgi:hypothetical protein